MLLVLTQATRMTLPPCRPDPERRPGYQQSPEHGLGNGNPQGTQPCPCQEPPYRHRDPSFHHTPPSVLDLPAHPNAAPVRAMGACPDFFVNARDAPGQAGGTSETPDEIPGRSWRAPGDGSGVRGRMAGKARGDVRGAALKRRGHRTERQRSLGNRRATRVAPRGSDGRALSFLVRRTRKESARTKP